MASLRFRWLIIVITLTLLGSLTHANEEESLLLRAESLCVLPKSKPMLYVQVANQTNAPIKTTVSVQVPSSWKIASRSKEISLAGKETRRLGFAVTEGNENRDNTYPIKIMAEGDGHKVARQQNISVTSAPYFKPSIDGDPSDWKDAIPVSFTTKGQKTTIATYWNRRRFSMLVSVDESLHIPRGGVKHHDAVQISLSPRGSVSSREIAAKSERFEYLVFVDENGAGRCCQLATPNMTLSETSRPRDTNSLIDEDADVAAKRIGSTTYYECSFSLKAVRKFIKPSEGREFFLSVLVHDPDGVGLRDWGEAAGLWQRQRNQLAWSNWIGAQWPEVPPMDCRTEWGMCSSRY